MRDILLVDDNIEIQYANKRMLEKQGDYRIRLAMNLSQAGQMIDECEPDLIVLDILFPNENGLDFVRALRKEKSTPVLFLSALHATRDVVAAMGAGGDDYLRKPYEYSELAARIEALLDLKL